MVFRLALIVLWLASCAPQTEIVAKKVPVPGESTVLIVDSFLNLALDQIAVSPSTLFPGDQITIAARLSNLGATDSTPQSLQWWLRGPAHQLLISQDLPVLKPGQEKDLSISVSIPSMATGMYELEGVVFPYPKEESPHRFVMLGKAAQPIVIGIRRPDLAVSILFEGFASSVTSGALVNLSVQFRNLGSSASASQSAKLYLNLENNETLKEFMTTVTAPALAPGETEIVNVAVLPLRGAGSYEWEIAANTEAADANPGNNTYTSGVQTFTSSLSLAWEADLPADSIFAPTWTEANADATQDVIVGAGDLSGGLFAVDGATGDTIWSFLGTGGMVVSAAVGDTNNDGAHEIFAGSFLGDFYALQATDGSLLWSRTFGLQTAPPALADFNLDGTREVLVIAGFSGTLNGQGEIAMLQADSGSILWSAPITSGAQFHSSPAVGDLNGDGYPDLVVGSGDETGSGFTTAYFSNAGTSFTRNWTVSGSLGIASGAVLADLDGDDKLDVVVPSADGTITAFRGLNGLILWQRDFSSTVFPNSPALGDVDGDGELELVVVAGVGEWPIDLVQSVMVLDANTGTDKWELPVGFGSGTSPILVDLDGNGSNEILLSVGGDLLEQPSTHGYSKLLILSGTGGVIDVFEVFGTILGSPAWVDIDGLGFPSIVFSTSRPGSVFKVATPYNAANSAWPRFRGDAANSGAAR